MDFSMLKTLKLSYSASPKLVPMLLLWLWSPLLVFILFPIQTSLLRKTKIIEKPKNNNRDLPHLTKFFNLMNVSIIIPAMKQMHPFV